MSRLYVFLLLTVPLFSVAQTDTVRMAADLCNEHNYQRAEQVLGQWLGHHPGDARAWYRRARIARFDNREQDAGHYLDKAIELDPELALAWKERAKLKALREDNKGALADFGRAIALDSTYTDAYFDRALTYYRIKQFEAAKADFTMVIRLDPTDYEAWYSRGNANFMTGLKDAACKDWEKAGALGYFIAFDLLEQHCQ